MNEWTYAGYPNSGSYANDIVNGNVSPQQIAMNEYFSSPEGQIAGIVNKLNEQYRDYDNAWSAEQAQISREWNAMEAEKNRQFNMIEAAKNRDWQSWMSSSSHQRETQDLIAAGLNPVLSAMGGNGAAVTSGATASGTVSSGSSANGNQSAGMAIASMLGTIMKNQNELELQRNNAELVQWQTLRTEELNKLLSSISANATIASAQAHAGATLGAAATAADAQKYGWDVSHQMQQEELKWKEEHPNNLYSTISSIANIAGIADEVQETMNLYGGFENWAYESTFGKNNFDWSGFWSDFNKASSQAEKQAVYNNAENGKYNKK